MKKAAHIMSAETVEILDDFAAISYLANGDGVYRKPILLSNVTWKEYECYLKNFEQKSGWRLAYDEGNLEFMPPLREHEEPKDILFLLTYEYCRHFDIALRTGGSTTFRLMKKSKGVEPDTCFYIQNVKKVEDQRRLKPETYPVPDIAVEIDVTHGSLDKFKIYTALKVPELWLYDGKKLKIFQLQNDKYNQSETSASLPSLTAGILTEYLKLSESDNQTNALKKFRLWLENQS